MARIKPKRHGVVTDMTAMCDVTFLLLTFFIMTTQFKKPDVEQIKPPSSISEKLLPDASLMTINATPDGKFYFQPVENATERLELLEKMGKKYNVTFDNKQKAAFQKVQSIGVPMNQLRSYLDLPEDEQKNYKSPTGIPMDSTNKQLTDWVEQSLSVNADYKLAIKGDVTTEYPKVKSLFEGLRDIDFLKFWLITSQEGKPNE
ncbi:MULTISPECIES: ExbD/TolR family protein [Chryseobacterium]|mgnify:FL=1|jgi:biopolymer transport protein ExbD|uniref:Biopolymer transport protein ExbD n=1 Tax=Chryseobacterium indoltheticum TaxID=254 RepID=A0A381FMH4_9FLAO|nr:MULTISPECIES: biopolymer transporter ExbD [Chryseobacterium]AZA62255.1 biopolymer transporter ExbD [Chryseobacterium indoltheticum]AZA75698.1 biopolymer transporter ExbD [Chryseobacterium indoltheticum]MDF2833327.1 biopolymer transporter ExbD [Chryseobacterium indoltheticum]MDQ8143483.1 biopolymer transporter ExbD [Chryseobacterium sp. CFS15]QQQ27540.1 biopolymer transporter ExbD [Chryseobacterium indoltheticum]